jgi:hypothetical protein
MLVRLFSGKAGAQMLGSIGALMPNIHGLNVSDNSFGDDGLVALLEGFWNNTSLVSLNIARNWASKMEAKKREQLIHHLNQLINNTSCPLESTMALSSSMKFFLSISPLVALHTCSVERFWRKGQPSPRDHRSVPGCRWS